ncbi:MAG: hypothetical protein IPI81_05930 [Flavobacteriales bacterium]|nr:hypothetical protein [Flavobacteriales bacterium]MCC6938664.1 hypothetical protein [Flavobacteriales bacterium]
MVRTRTLTFALALFTIAAFAQGQTPELDALNGLYAGTVKFKIDRDRQLVIDQFDAKGLFRQDIVPIEFIDPASMHISTEEDAMILGCISTQAQCFNKEIFKLNTIRRTGRCDLPRPAADPSGEAFMQAMRDLIDAEKQRMAAAGETRQGTSRMK